MTPTNQQGEQAKRGLRAKIIAFTKYPDGQDKDCIAITDDGREIMVDPFVGCSWEYEKRQHLLNEWFDDPEAWEHEYKGEKSGVWLTSAEFKLIPCICNNNS